MTTDVRSRPRLVLAAVLAAIISAALVLGVAPGRADAHDGDAIIVVEAVHPAGQSMHYVVRVTWSNDGHAALDATVTATGIAADGTQLTPVPLTPVDEDGRYAGVVDYPAPGSWTVRITAIDPTGVLDQAQEVAAAPATATPDVTTGTGTADGGFAPADDGTGDSADADASDSADAADEGGDATDAAAPGASDESSDEGGFPVLLVVAAAAVVVVGGFTAVNLIRRTQADPPAGRTGGAASASDGNGSTGPSTDADTGVSAGESSEATTSG